MEVSLRIVASKKSFLKMGCPKSLRLFEGEHADVVELARRKLDVSVDLMEKELVSMMCLYSVPFQGSEKGMSLLKNMAYPAYISLSHSLLKVSYQSEPVLIDAAHTALEDDRLVHPLDHLNMSMMRGEILSDDKVAVLVRILVMRLVTDLHSDVYSDSP